MRRDLTDTYLRSLKPPLKGRIEIGDSRCPGLEFRMTAADMRTWSFRSRKVARVTIGPYPDITLKQARARGDALRQQIAGGGKPNELKRKLQAEALTKTFQVLSDRYINEHAKRFKKSVGDDERNLKLHILPLWSKRRYDQIRRADIIELIEGLIADDKPVLANRVQSLISKIFSFAVDASLIDANPATKLKKRAKETALTRTLDDSEIRLFWSKIMSQPVSPSTGLALKLELLTGMRPGEVAGLTRSEIINLDDDEHAAILIHGERIKNARSHLVPLSPMARQVLTDALALAGEGAFFVFPARHDNDRPLDPHTFAKAMRRFADDLDEDVPGAVTWKADPPTPHDLRRSFATRLSALNVPREDRDALLNHMGTDVGSKHYDQYQRQKEKRAALNLWAGALAVILDGGRGADVLPMRRRP